MPKEMFYHLKIVRHGVPIELAGISHGIARARIPIPKNAEDFLNALLSRYDGRIVTEGSTKRMAAVMVPKKFLSRAEPIESPFVREVLGDNALKAVGVYSISLANRAKRIASGLKRSDIRVISRPDVRYRANSPEDAFIINVRNLFMAASLLEKARLDKQRLFLSTGAYHAVGTHYFLENPKVALRYLSRARSPLEKISFELGGEEGRQTMAGLLNDAEAEFKLSRK